jgi:hypothetical protein
MLGPNSTKQRQLDVDQSPKYTLIKKQIFVFRGVIAQLVEYLVYTEFVGGSIPSNPKIYQVLAVLILHWKLKIAKFYEIRKFKIFLRGDCRGKPPKNSSKSELIV